MLARLYARNITVVWGMEVQRLPIPVTDGERVITEDGADLPDLERMLNFDKDGKPRKK